jgi:hypothetical protein
MTYPPYPLLSASRALQCARRDSRRSHKESAPRASRIWRCVATPAIQQMQSHRSIRSVAVDGNRFLKIRQLRLWAGTALLLIATACATDPRLGAQQVASPGTGAGPAVRNCSTPDTLIKALTVESMSVGDARTTLSWLETSTDGLNLVSAERLVGACAHLLAGFRMSAVYFSNAIVLTFNADSKLTLAPEKAAYSKPAIVSDEEHPDWQGGEFVMAERVDARQEKDGPREHFVGLWNTGMGSALVVFTRDEHGAFGHLRPILTSRLPLRSVSYFPAVDSPSGRLALVQEAGAEMRLLSLDWFHPQAFAIQQ